MTRHLNKGLPFAEWPSRDRLLWEQAFPTDPFAERAQARSETAVYGLQSAYRLWLGFLQIAAPELLDEEPADRVTKQNVEMFVDYLGVNCRDTTICAMVQRLDLALRELCPDQDWSWIYRMSRIIARTAQPMRHPQVLSSELYQVAFQLIDLAHQDIVRHGRVGKRAATLHRDGMLIGCFVEAPMRRRAMAALTVDRHVQAVGSRWHLTVPEELAKTGRLQSYPLSAELSEQMSYYLKEVRPLFPGSDRHTSLWPQIGRPMTDKMLRRRTIKWTKMLLGVEVSPHRFRNAAANFIATADPENIRVARDLLGHRSFAMTETHYIDVAQSRLAGRELARILAARQEVAHG